MNEGRVPDLNSKLRAHGLSPGRPGKKLGSAWPAIGRLRKLCASLPWKCFEAVDQVSRARKNGDKRSNEENDRNRTA